MIARLFSRLFLIVAATLAFQSLVFADEVTFNKPKLGSYRLDWCYKWGVQCGEVAADKFCQQKGYDGASVFAEAVDIGVDTQTRVLGTGQVCADPSCDGFKFITCEDNTGGGGPPPPPAPPPPSFIDKTFTKPSLAGQRIHYCFKPNGGCGKKAADAFCDIQGYDEAIAFQQSNVLLGAKAPRFIGSGQTCQGSLNCVGFKAIVCRKEP